MTTYLCTFYTDGQDDLQDRRPCANRLLAQAKELGFDTEHFVWDWGRFKASTLYGKYPNLFTADNKLGFWAWKPYIIAHALYLMSNDDTLVYLDSDLSITKPDLLLKMIGQCDEHALFIDSGWRNDVWTPLAFYDTLGLDYHDYLNIPHVWSAIHVWSNLSKITIESLGRDININASDNGVALDWYGSTLRVALNLGRRAHGSRYDQSLLSLIVARDNFTVLGNEYANAVAHPPEGLPCVS